MSNDMENRTATAGPLCDSGASSGVDVVHGDIDHGDADPAGTPGNAPASPAGAVQALAGLLGATLRITGRGRSTDVPVPDRAVDAAEWDSGDGSRAVAPPVELDTAERRLEVTRSFAFLDICGFTTFTDTHGPHTAIEAVSEFRQLVRDTAGKRGVRVAKWLGDGVLLISVSAPPLVATAVDVVSRAAAGATQLPVRAGVTTGQALFFDGDDYIGRPVNLASRLCDAAVASQVLADAASCVELPGWVTAAAFRPVSVKGAGRVRAVSLTAAEGALGGS